VVLSNLPTDVALERVVVNRVGGGGLYLSDGSPWSWSSVLGQADLGGGRYSDTADLYFQPNPAVVDANQLYQLDLYFAGRQSPYTIYVRVTDDPRLRKVAGATS
jgi:hypothetical protein